jgi:predicted nucleic acid-binding Zn ribbon protein
MYQNRPLRLGEFDELKEDIKVEVRTCSLEDYCLEYPEPVAEIQEVIGEKLIIFNSSGLVSLYKNQMKVGTIKHQGPQEVVYESDTPKKTDTPLFLKPVSPLEEGVCEQCGNQTFLTHKLTDEEGVESLVCIKCSKEIEAEIGKLAPSVFGTTLDERREVLKNEEKQK